LVYNKATQDKHERNVSGLSGGKEPGNNKKKGRKNNKGGGMPRGDITKSYTHEEWFKLSEEQRQKIRNLQNAKKTKHDSQVSSLTTLDSGVNGGANGSVVTASTDGSTDPANAPVVNAKRG
jgi:hypothetical protein